jgi:hypothetical protein
METEFEFETINDISDVESSCAVTRGVISGNGAFFGVNNFITTNGFGDADERKAVARKVNALEFAQKRIEDCGAVVNNTRLLGGEGDVNLLYVDFWQQGDIVQVVQEHNRKLGRRDQMA